MAEQGKVKANSKLEQKLDELYYLLDSAKPSAFSKSKIVIDRDVAYEILGDMRKELPEELKRYREMTNRYGAIIGDAEDRAVNIEREAMDQQAKLIKKQEVVRKAYGSATEMVNQARSEADNILMAANQEADMIREGAFEYTQNMMHHLQSLLSESYSILDTAYRPVMEGVGRKLTEVNLALQGLEEPVSGEYEEEDTVAAASDMQEAYDTYENGYEDYEDEYEEEEEYEDQEYDDDYER